MQLEPEHVLGISMVALLMLGGLAQYMQSRGGRIARAAPSVILALLLLVSVGGMIALGGALASVGEWREALATGDTPSARTP